MEEKICLKSMPLDKLESYLASIGQPKYRASQIFKWLSRGVLSFDEMTDISKGLRDRLEKETFINRVEIVSKDRKSVV